MAFPPEWNATENQNAVLATIGDEADFAMFDALIRKGTAVLNASKEGGTNGVRRKLLYYVDEYFTAAQAFRLMKDDRSWEDYFPWIVFRHRALGHNHSWARSGTQDWIEWAANKHGAHYETFDINSLVAEWQAETASA